MACVVWRLQGIDTGGADLILSRIVPWSNAGAVPVISISSSFAPTSGALENLLLDDDSTCVFAAADIRKPGFYIEFTLSVAAVPWGFRFSGPSAGNWLLQHQVVVDGVACSLGMVQWVTGLSAEPAAPLLFGRAYGEWAQQTSVGSRNWYDCAMSADGQVMLAVESNYLYLSTDGGVTWVQQTAAGWGNWYSCAMSADGQVMLAGMYGGYFYLSTDGGATWARQTAAGSRNWYSCAMSADGQVMLVEVDGGYFYLSTDGGATWVQQTSVGSRNWYSCAMSADGQVMLVGSYNGYLYLSTDGGATWAQQTAAGRHNWYSCAMSADGQVMLAVESNYLYLSTDGGVTWVQQTAAGWGNWYSCAMSADGQVMLAGMYGGYFYLSTDGGATWTRQTAAGSRNWHSCAMSADGSALLTSVVGGNLHFFVRQPAIYWPAPIQQSRIALHIAHSNQALLLPQGLSSIDALAAASFDTEHTGPGTIYGTVEQKLTGDATLPLKRRVRLHRSRDGLLVRETWSDENGHYRFDGLSTRYEYDVIAWDHEGQFRSTIANNLKPEVLP